MEPLQGERAREQARQLNSAPRRRTALIVDDCATLHAMMRDVLEPEYDCESVTSAEEAISVASRQTPDVIISDVVMEGTDGFELCRRIRADRRLHEIPLILLTSNPDPDGRATGLEEGADDYLSKPFRPRELLARVRSLVRLREARQEVLRQNRALERAHEELLTAQRQLLDAERLATLGMLATGLAHEINNPLAVVWAGFEQINESIRPEMALAPPKPEETAEIDEIRGEVRSGLERIRGIAQKLAMLAAAEDNRHVRFERGACANVTDGVLDHSSIPAMHADMKLAMEPAATAFSPRRARSDFRFGARPPIPPICMAIELKLAKPHSA